MSEVPMDYNGYHRPFIASGPVIGRPHFQGNPYGYSSSMEKKAAIAAMRLEAKKARMMANPYGFHATGPAGAGGYMLGQYGFHATGAAGAGGYPLGAYGVLRGWVPKKSRLSQCPEMLAWYKKYIVATKKLKQLPSFLGMRAGSKAKTYKRQQKEYERMGKAAWKECKKGARVSAAEEMAMEDSFEMLDIDDISVDPVAEQQLAMMSSGYSPQAAAIAAAGGVPQAAGYAPAPAGPNMLLWGGLAAGGLVLLLLLRK